MKKILAIFIVIGVLAVSSSAFAGVNVKIEVDNTKYRPIAQAQTQPPAPRNLPNGQRPPAPPNMSGSPAGSRDIKGQPPMPPKDGKRPPMSGDRRPPNGQMPPMPRSGDRRPPNFNNGQRPPMPQR